MCILWNCLNSSGKFETIKPLITTEIKRKENDVNINAKSNNPALLGEWVPVIIHITAEDYITVASLHVGFQMDGNNEQSSKCSKNI